MLIAILSDVHGNLEALEEVLKRVRDIKPDAVICLGDVVGYGPDPDEVTRICDEVSDKTVMGNHDYGLVKLWSNPRDRTKILNHFSPVARRSLLWTFHNTSEKTINTIARLGLEIFWNDLHIVHASPGYPLDWQYIYDAAGARMYMGYVRGWAALVGHTHVPAIFSRTMKGMTHVVPRPFEEYNLSTDDIHILNPGSVGQPRDGDPRASFGLLEITRGRAKFRIERTEYPLEVTAEKIRKAGLPGELAARLFIGR